MEITNGKTRDIFCESETKMALNTENIFKFTYLSSSSIESTTPTLVHILVAADACYSECI